MTHDDAELMAYADGELDPLSAKRVERAIAADPALQASVDAHRALRQRLDAAYSPVLDQPVPDTLTAMLQTNVVPFARPAPVVPPRRWLSGLAVAAALIAGIGVGTQWRPAATISESGGVMIAAGKLANALDTQLASTGGDTHMPVSFRNDRGQYCRVFASRAADGIACKAGDSWQLRETRAPGPGQSAAYRQAGSNDTALMASAQAMMAGDPLDAAGESKARAAGWR